VVEVVVEVVGVVGVVEVVEVVGVVEVVEVVGVVEVVEVLAAVVDPVAFGVPNLVALFVTNNIIDVNGYLPFGMLRRCSFRIIAPLAFLVF